MLLAFSLQSLDAGLRDWAASLQMPGEAIFRLGLAAALGGLVGLEREVRGRQAGFRTNLLVALGSALVMIVSVFFAYVNWPPHSGFNLNIDPARVAYSVMAGVGFLGAGAIMKHDGNVRGLTTAAGLWCVAAVGLACGLGMYLVSIFATILVLIALWTLDILEKRLPRVRYRTITVRRPWRPGIIGQTVELVQSLKAIDVVDTSFVRLGDLATVDIRLYVAFRSRDKFWEFERELDGHADCQLISWSDG